MKPTPAAQVLETVGGKPGLGRPRQETKSCPLSLVGAIRSAGGHRRRLDRLSRRPSRALDLWLSQSRWTSGSILLATRSPRSSALATPPKSQVDRTRARFYRDGPLTSLPGGSARPVNRDRRLVARDLHSRTCSDSLPRTANAFQSGHVHRHRREFAVARALSCKAPGGW